MTMGERNPAVDAWMEQYDNPLNPLVARVREIMLAADPRIEETVKWSTPTFTYRGNLASFQPRSKRFVSILFHEGASIPGSLQILEGGGDHARYIRLADEADVDARRAELEAVVRAWCDARDAASTT